jgi:hypothetical protein
VIISDAVKMASILNQRVENERIHGSLQGPFLYMGVVCTRQDIEDCLFEASCLDNFASLSDC